MKLYSGNKDYKLYNGNMLDMLEVIQKESIDSIVCDPPYGLTSITKRFGKENSAECQYGKDGSFARLSKGFMGKEWDGSGIEYNVDAWTKCYEVLKPGGYLLAFGGSRTYHRIACAIEDAGFEIRDTIMWLYGSGFPKSMNIGLAIDKKNGVDSEIVGKKEIKKLPTNGIINYEKEGWRKGGEDISYSIKKATNEWSGWGTALKPSFEPIIVARKPFKGSLVDNVITTGVGGINIDECRVAFNGDKWNTQRSGKSSRAYQSEKTTTADGMSEANDLGRFPANTILTYDKTDFEEVCGGFPNGKKNGSISKPYKINNQVYGDYGNCKPFNAYDDSGSAARYFYCAKASKKDRDEGLDNFEEKTKVFNGKSSESSKDIKDVESRFTTVEKNTHPTVKPTNLMQYLVRLITPNGGTILDPFNGSGSTGKAVMYENREKDKNYKYIGIELTEEYLPIAKARIEYVCNMSKEKLKDMQLSIFDLGEYDEWK